MITAGIFEGVKNFVTTAGGLKPPESGKPSKHAVGHTVSKNISQRLMYLQPPPPLFDPIRKKKFKQQ